MNLQWERISELTHSLQLYGIEAQAVSLAQQAANEEWDYLQFLAKALEAENNTRHQRKQAMFTRTAGFPSIKTLDEFDFHFASGAPKKTFMSLLPWHLLNVRKISYYSVRLAWVKRILPAR